MDLNNSHLRINYSKDGTAVSDSSAIYVAHEIYKKSLQYRETNYPVSTSNLLEAFRVLYCRGLIDRNKISFTIDGDITKIITIDENGSWSECPDGFSIDWIDKFFTEIFEFQKK